MSRVDPTVFAVVLPTLLVAHTVADHVVQTDHQAAGKTREPAVVDAADRVPAAAVAR